ncbi:programmed cell death protein 7 [Engraulis encrasicolus]|uniref:programmed cell death protein 7 n=1 Tax=Engraulis encrasicolus TaxID=184585 RepID=UPI002FD175A8
MENSPYYQPDSHQQQAANMPNMPPNYAPSGGPYYPAPAPGFPPVSYQQPPTPQGNGDHSSRPGLWPGQNAYQASQPQTPPPWPPFPPTQVNAGYRGPPPPTQGTAGYGRAPPPPTGSAGYGCPPPPTQGNASYGCPPPGYPPQPAGFEGHGGPPIPPPFDPHRPPPGFREPQSNQISAFVEAQRAASSVPQQPTFESHHAGPTNQWTPVPAPSQTSIREGGGRPPDHQRHFASTGPQTLGASSANTEDRWQRGPSEFLSKQKEPLLQPPKPEPLDEESVQRKQDERWLENFLSRRRRVKTCPQTARIQTLSVSQVREDLYGTLKLVSDLSSICQTLKENLENDALWTESHSQAVGLMHNIQGKLNVLTDPEAVLSIKKKLSTTLKKRTRARRQKLERLEEEQKREERLTERHAAIDAWRMKRIRQVEEKKREEELKAAADAVLSEVRKKQGDAKKMVDILRALEKLRKLRKEAAARKGVYPEKESDEVFEGHLSRLRSLIGKRTALYGAEEKALRVMLEGEQEEERKRDVEKRQRKEREKLLHKRRQVENMLFGDAIPDDHPLLAFQDYYLQAESSLPALVQIRREWDQFLTPDGSAVPQAWVLPEPPADEAWATALEKHISLTD